MQALFCRDKAWARWWTYVGFRGCEGPQPCKSETAIGALIRDLEGVRSLGAALNDASFVLPRQGMGPMVDLCRVPRLRGTAALQVRNGHWSSDQGPGGRPVPRRRAERCKLCFAATRHGPDGGPMSGSAAARDRSPASQKRPLEL